MTDEIVVEDLIVSVLQGVAGDRDRCRLEAWRRAGPENERAFQEFARVWELGEDRALAAIVSAPPPLERITGEAERRRAHVIPLRAQALRTRPPWRLSFAWAAAAAVAVAAGVGVVSTLREPAVVISTGPSETSTTQLADGSIVRLGPDSRVEIRGAEQRSVRLEGTAFFAVATDSSTSFTVHARGAVAEVMGTRFELRADADSLRLVVVEGRVRLSAAGRNVEAGYGAVSRIVGQSPPSPPQHVDVWALLEWPGGLLIYQATPLSQVVDEVSAFFDRPIVVRDPDLLQKRVTAWFEDQSFEEVVTALCAVLGVECRVGDTAEVGR
jgi:transmembrane sensor